MDKEPVNANGTPVSKWACPLCKSEDIKDVSLWGRPAPFTIHTPIGTKHPPKRKTFDAICCNRCGILFRLIEK